MGAINDLMEQVGTSTVGTIAGNIGDQIGYGIGKITGYNQNLMNDQLKQQQALTNIQAQSNYGLMKESYKEQKALWDATNMEEQIKHIKNAGLNPALLYAKGGTGGSTGSGGTSVAGGQSANAAQLKQAQTQQSINGMAMMKLNSEIKLNEAQANKLNAEAETTIQSRDVLVEKLKQEGKSTWLQNLQQEFIMDSGSNVMVTKNKIYGQGGVTETSVFNQTAVNNMLKLAAETGNQTAQTILTNNKAEGYFTELMNATVVANSDMIRAMSQKMATEFQTGDYTTWKTFTELASNLIGDLAKAWGVSKIGAVSPVRNNTTNITNVIPKTRFPNPYK